MIVHVSLRKHCCVDVSRPHQGVDDSLFKGHPVSEPGEEARDVGRRCGAGHGRPVHPARQPSLHIDGGEPWFAFRKRGETFHTVTVCRADVSAHTYKGINHSPSFLARRQPMGITGSVRTASNRCGMDEMGEIGKVDQQLNANNTLTDHIVGQVRLLPPNTKHIIDFDLINLPHSLTHRPFFFLLLLFCLFIIVPKDSYAVMFDSGPSAPLSNSKIHTDSQSYLFLEL